MPRKNSTAERQVNARIRRAALLERIEFLDSKPDGTRADARLATKLAKEHNRLLMKY